MKALSPVYTAPSEQAAKDRFEEFAAEWGGRYPAIVQLWRNSWAEFVPFLEYDVEIRRVICTTNAIESINARYRRAVRARGHFPTREPADGPGLHPQLRRAGNVHGVSVWTFRPV